jgi:hypothetical protein
MWVKSYLELWIDHFPDAAGAGGVVECGAEMTHVLLPEIVIQLVVMLSKNFLWKPDLRRSYKR